MFKVMRHVSFHLLGQSGQAVSNEKLKERVNMDRRQYIRLLYKREEFAPHSNSMSNSSVCPLPPELVEKLHGTLQGNLPQNLPRTCLENPNEHSREPKHQRERIVSFTSPMSSDIEIQYKYIIIYIRIYIYISIHI